MNQHPQHPQSICEAWRIMATALPSEERDPFISFTTQSNSKTRPFTAANAQPLRQSRERPNLVVSSAEACVNDILSHEEIQFVESVSNEDLHAPSGSPVSSAWSKYKGECPAPSDRPQSASARAKYAQEKAQDGSLWGRFTRHLVDFKDSEALRPVAQYLFHQPALFVTFIITFTYMIDMPITISPCPSNSMASI